ncbi:hypothetical protein C0995_007009 [Termitomyces sp. Mi166|nr:hypothetical protein C0995_007009 [Termitomyces sp. Mi166\
MSRSIHKRVPLPYPVEGGLGDFLPPEALKVVAIDYQEGLLKRLDEEVRGSPEAVESVAQTVLNTAPFRNRTLAFNYASLALNNSYFLDQLLPPPTEGEWKNHQHEMSRHLADNIRKQYGTMIQLKSSFSAAAMGMFSSGWLWLVTDQNGRLGIIPTFGPSTLLIRSRTYMGGVELTPPLNSDVLLYRSTAYFTAQSDAEMWGATEEEMATALEDDIRPLRSPTGSPTSPTSPSPSSPVSGVSGGKQPPPSPSALHPRFLSSTSVCAEEPDAFQKKADTLHSSSNKSARPLPEKSKTLSPLGDTLYPLFCLSVHEHAWMAAGYGVWGKEAWLKQFWTVINWKRVSEAYRKIFKEDATLQ